jgi:hypothetical protein
MPDVKRSEGVPVDRLTRLCGAMTEALEAADGYRDGDKAVVMLSDGERGGIGLHGYGDDTAALVDLIIHLQAIFEANGKKLVIMPLGRDC